MICGFTEFGKPATGLENQGCAITSIERSEGNKKNNKKEAFFIRTSFNYLLKKLRRLINKK
jgi:hypothetical protein